MKRLKYSLDRRVLLQWFRSRRIFILFIVCVASYEFLPLVLFKLPDTYNGWTDKDFQANPVEDVVILRWTRFFRSYSESPVILKPENCPHTEPSNSAEKASKLFASCRITHDRRYIRKSNALVFHSFDLMNEEVPTERSEKQLWVYLQSECPIYTKLNLQAYREVFNWTMTYRRDSDVYHPYGHIFTRKSTEHHIHSNKSNILGRKTGLVAWIVSSCDSYSKREYLVAQLQDFLPVDVYGWCGQECPSNEDCYSHVAKTHKFYLSFENSLCTDYITEKFFNAMRQDMVPVVYGGSSTADYSDIAPSGSYIDTRQFKSVKDLALYLLFLDQHDEEYLKYFQWKGTYEVVESQGMCTLCQKVYEEIKTTKVNHRPSYKLYKDLWNWWNYMAYDTSAIGVQPKDSDMSHSYNFKLGIPACAPPRNYSIGTSKPDFEPGVMNGKLYGKLGSWVKDLAGG